MRNYDPAKIDSLSGEALKEEALDISDGYWRLVNKSSTAYVDGTILGIAALHASIRMHGIDYVSIAAPKDWAWQLVGILGCGYSGETKGAVRAALIEQGWQKGGSLDERH